MSLWSILNSSQGLSSGTYGTAQTTAAMQRLIAEQRANAEATDTSSGPSNTGSSISISANAELAATENADNAKSIDTLAAQVRQALDQWKKDGKGTPDLSHLSARALSAMALDHGKQFTPTEMAEAKAELHSRSIAAYTRATSGKSGIAAMSAYNSWLIARYDAASSEERSAMGWTDQTRAGAQNFLTRASAADPFGE
ncbi:hypothetical protein [Sphingobium subterraneum]|uniref:Uncharacterized protein n=1 Tax=Sphingobium subterraneum TaxID=627688 RepID=A0A841IZ36_9SPHN|nr:hypothetical protein [Sphingobium subterraneum]MBB6123923.1 hypothetical protein [Sphingobium subterraneum]